MAPTKDKPKTRSKAAMGTRANTKSKPKAKVAKSVGAKSTVGDEAVRAPGRPRCPEAHQAILDAAAELLETLDYQNITIERIASQAKVGKPTIYRWWKTKADLILEAYREESSRRLPSPELTDDSFADLEDHLKRLFRIHRSRRVAQGFRALIAEGQLDPQFGEKLREEILTFRRAAFNQIIVHGIETGQFHKSVDPNLVDDVLAGAFWFRLLNADRQPFNDAFAEDLMTLVRPYLQNSF